MNIIRKWIRQIRFVTLIVPLIVPLVLLCLVAVGFLAGYLLRISGEIMAFAVGLATGSMLTMMGIIFSLQWLAEAEKHRHEQAMEDLDEEIKTHKTARKSWMSGMVWRVGNDDRE